MVKDRLQEFQNKANKYDDGESISLIHYFAIIDMEGPFMDEFFRQIDTLRNTIDKIKQLVDQVEQLQHAMLAPHILPETKEKLEETMAKVKQIGNHVRTRLKQMQQMNNTHQRSHVRQRIIDSQIDACTKYFCTVMNRYYETVITYRERCKLQLVRQLQIAHIKRNDDQVEEILNKGRFTLFPETIIELQEARQNLDEMALRYRNLIELEDSIEELHDMFFHLTYLLYSQDDQIDLIQNKISYTEIDMEQSNQINYARKVSHCFHIKLSRKRFVSSLLLSLSRLFPSCL